MMTLRKLPLITLAGALALGAGWLLGKERTEPAAAAGEAPAAPAAASPRHAVQIHIRHADGPPRVNTGRTNLHGEPVTAACAACHTTTKPNPATRSTADLDQFHQGLFMQHGNLNCLSCHNAQNYDTLRLADGAALEFSSAMQLCGQCHGPQMRDYRNGAHGGMNGHWDLTRGPRARNTCVDCHDPHAPHYPEVQPVFPPAPANRRGH